VKSPSRGLSSTCWTQQISNHHHKFLGGFRPRIRYYRNDAEPRAPAGLSLDFITPLELRWVVVLCILKFCHQKYTKNIHKSLAVEFHRGRHQPHGYGQQSLAGLDVWHQIDNCTLSSECFTQGHILVAGSPVKQAWAFPWPAQRANWQYLNQPIPTQTKQWSLYIYIGYYWFVSYSRLIVHSW
jgi:hypothetical protein